MPVYNCPYISDGAHYTANIRAASAEEAAATMANLPWGPNARALGEPRLEYASWLKETVTPATTAFAFIVLIALLGNVQDHPKVVALLDNARSHSLQSTGQMTPAPAKGDLHG